MSSVGYWVLWPPTVQKSSESLTSLAPCVRRGDGAPSRSSGRRRRTDGNPVSGMTACLARGAKGASVPEELAGEPDSSRIGLPTQEENHMSLNEPVLTGPG